MGEKNSFAVIAQKRRIFFLSGRVIISDEVPKLIVSNKTHDVFDIMKRRIASVRLEEKGVLKVIPKGNLLVSFSGFEKVPTEIVGSNGKKIEVFGTIKTERGVKIFSGNGRETIISQSPEAIAYCHSLKTANIQKEQ